MEAAADHQKAGRAAAAAWGNSEVSVASAAAVPRCASEGVAVVRRVEAVVARQSASQAAAVALRVG